MITMPAFWCTKFGDVGSRCNFQSKRSHRHLNFLQVLEATKGGLIDTLNLSSTYSIFDPLTSKISKDLGRTFTYCYVASMILWCVHSTSHINYNLVSVVSLERLVT